MVVVWCGCGGIRCLLPERKSPPILQGTGGLPVGYGSLLCAEPFTVKRFYWQASQISPRARASRLHAEACSSLEMRTCLSSLTVVFSMVEALVVRR